jgi:hypothetical protein
LETDFQCNEQAADQAIRDATFFQRAKEAEKGRLVETRLAPHRARVKSTHLVADLPRKAVFRSKAAVFGAPRLPEPYFTPIFKGVPSWEPHKICIKCYFSTADCVSMRWIQAN